MDHPVSVAAPDPNTREATRATAEFLRAAFDSAQDMWRRQLAAAGGQYQPGHLIFFHTQIHTPCGVQTAQVGPFYCPPAHGIYLNTDFFEALNEAYNLRSGFAAAYVTAGVWIHELQGAGALSQSDLEDIIRAAAVVGDDFQRNQAGADLAPETWTHGSSAQRVHWLDVGRRTGSPAECDTFSGQAADPG
jgi:uncharacterized protein